ncbi:uncharacterized protein VNE69_02029 [Vairimorpha necatrix]|uniref:LAGLIDADG homing endonuclease n=1 Tax=Vairimorpha necatrix TaxID=6039 RepID=A0AAX4J952_9MICR
MFLFIFFVLGSDIVDNNHFIPRILVFKSQKENEHGIVTKLEQNKVNNKKSEKIIRERDFSSRKSVVSSELSNVKMKNIKLYDLENFVWFMKAKYIEYHNAHKVENNLNDNEKLNLFNNFLILWNSEKVDVDGPSGSYKFQSNKIYNRYKNFCRKNNIWIKYYCEINNKYLPQIKNEIKRSSIQDFSKKIIIDNLELISQAMAYFEKLFPKYLNYRLHANLLKTLYKLIIERFPLLFEYFNIIERFIDLYEMIINQCIKKVDDSIRIKFILKKMSCNITKIINEQDFFFK